MRTKSQSCPELPLDIFHEILLNLPVKTLTKFKCVCKSWFSLISSPFFQQDHYRRQQPLLLIARYVTPNRIRISAYDSNKEEGLTTVLNTFSKRVPLWETTGYNLVPVQSCRGLVCMKSVCEITLLCNPSTQELITLPPPATEGYLGYIPIDRPTIICTGFGYAASINKFKLVRFFEARNDQIQLCEVLTVGTDQDWRPAKSPPFVVNCSHVPFLHGAFYLMFVPFWAALEIIAFDVETEEYRETPIRFPEHYYKLVDSGELRTVGRRLTELQGSLCLVLDFGEFEGRFEIWFLKDYEKGAWVKQYDIDLSSTYDSTYDPKGMLSAHPLAIMGDGTILMNEFGYVSDGYGMLCETRLLCYNPKNKRFTDLGKECSAISYVESFFPLETMQDNS